MQVIDIERHLLGRAGLGALRPEAKLLFLSNQRGSLSIKQAMGVNDLSDRGSSPLLNRLSSLCLSTITADAVDKRVRKTGFADKADIAEFILG